MTDFAKFEEPSLPPIDEFYSSLHLKTISPEEYGFAQRVFTTFNCKTLGDYHDIYLGKVQLFTLTKNSKLI